MTLSPSKVFLFLASLFGLLLIFITPPYQVPDEPNHFFRAFQISEGHFVSMQHKGIAGGYVPKSLVTLKSIYKCSRMIVDKTVKVHLSNVKAAWRQKLDHSDQVFVNFVNTALYSPVPYVPQVVGIFIGKTFDFPPVALVYLGRFCNLIVWMCLVWGAIRLLPLYRWLFVVLALLPMSLFEVSSLSADAVTYGLAFFSIAFFFKLAFDNRQKLGIREIIVMTFITVLLTLSKNVYFLMFLLLLLLPANKFENLRQRLFILLWLAFANILALIGWSYFGNISENMQIYIKTCSPPYGVDNILQLKYIFSNFFTYIKIVIRTFVNNHFFYQSFIGNFGWLNIQLPRLTTCLGMFMLFFYAVLDASVDFFMSVWHRLLLAGYAIVTIFIIATTLYLVWSPVGGLTIDGLQGRYFIPIAPVFFAIFRNNLKICDVMRRWLPSLTVVYLVFMLSVSLWFIAHRYYDHQFIDEVYSLHFGSQSCCAVARNAYLYSINSTCSLQVRFTGELNYSNLFKGHPENLFASSTFGGKTIISLFHQQKYFV